MNKYKVTHKANGKQEWEVQEFEATGFDTDNAGNLKFYGGSGTRRGLIAAGWWMCVERIDPKPPPSAVVLDTVPKLMDTGFLTRNRP